ncbi:hypothetical protein [Bacillus sp. FJAT-27251]|uniref:hypothetical protein n=1 Tax=Bacillus sp. FJAT-27251 TaxID=1684142 RepID=UPI0006A7BE8E|nr:hypothetical protein [Bacillus sp. FJAT-27251]
MAKLPIRPIFEGVKKYGPRAGKLVKENWKEVAGAIGTIGAGVKAIQEMKGDKKETKEKQGKLHYRKERYNNYKSKILRELDSKNRNELFQHILEIEYFIQQIQNEEKNEFGIKKPIHDRRIDNWNNILIQIKDKMHTRDYHEFIKIYNNTAYQSEYFVGFEGLVEKFIKLKNSQNNDALIHFISTRTNRSHNQIKRDFSF